MKEKKEMVYRGEKMTRGDLMRHLQNLQRLGQLSAGDWEEEYGVENEWEDWLDEEMDSVEDLILDLVED